MKYHVPRILVSALRGGAGKSIVSVGIAASLNKAGKRIAVFKKGPDYIDSSWLSMASGVPCYNLDTYLMGETIAYQSFLKRTSTMDAAVVEGNRGLFDGTDVRGRHSSAALARLLSSPVVLILDCTKATRTVASSLLGCQKMDADLRIGGVILNRVAGERHARIVEECVRHYCDVPVLGTIPRQSTTIIPERHLGLLPPQEYQRTEDIILRCRELIEANVDLRTLWNIAVEAPELEVEEQESSSVRSNPESRIRVGVIRDEAFHFYYPENIEELESRGASVIDIDATEDAELPDVDALYIGGGFPEVHSEKLWKNHSFKASLRNAVEMGLPVYAECGGALYLAKGIEVGGSVHPMSGIVPVVFSFHPRPQGHGYTILEVERSNPYFSPGSVLKGHEFHYSRVISWDRDTVDFVCSVKRGYGFDGTREGLCYKNVFATFSHIHVLGECHWAKGIVQKAHWYRGINSIQ